MKYLAIMGSFRKNKNTNAALDAFIKGVEKSGDEVEKFYLRDMEIKDCIACGHCSRTGECFIDDDMQTLYKLLDTVDGFIFAAPTYFNSINALAKRVVDRSQRYWGIKYDYGRDKVSISEKRGMYIGVGGAPYHREQFIGSESVIDLFFKAVSANHIGNYAISNTDQVPVSDRPEVLKELEELGEKFKDIDNFYIHK